MSETTHPVEGRRAPAAAPETTRAASYVAIVGSIAAHGLAVLAAPYVGVRGTSELTRLLPVTEMVEVDLPEAPKTITETALAATPVPARARVASPTPATPPPTAAQAGQVLEAKSDAVDFGDSFATGAGDAYAGGVTDKSGTSTSAVRDVRAQGNADGEGKEPGPPAPDLSRPPRLDGSARWQCPFPDEADDAGIDHAVVTLHVDIAANGGVRNVTTVSDPGNGFGREARRCAGSKRWLAGWDRGGHAIAASATVNVRFER
jgi:protein TonB